MAKVHAKRMATGIKQPSKIGKDRSHLLTGDIKSVPFVEVQCIRTNTLGQIKMAHTKRFTIIFAAEISRNEDIIVIIRHL